MWDADPIGPWYNGGQRIIYPAIVGYKHGSSHPPQNGWVMIHTHGNKSWMGPDEKNLRLPTEDELKLLQWPELK
jgi:hypothetical protein